MDGLKSILMAALIAVSACAAQSPLNQSNREFEDAARLAGEARLAGRVPEAITLYRKAVELSPRWEEGWWYLGTLLYSSDRSQEAADVFRRVAGMRGKDGAAWAFLGLAEFELKHWDPALEALKKARRYGVDNNQLFDVATFDLGILLNRAGWHDEAFEILQVLAKEDREEPAIVDAFGLNALLMAKTPAEIPAADRELVTLAGRAWFKATQLKREEAAKLYGELLARYPGTANVHYAYAMFLRTDQGDAAFAEFERELKVNPNNTYARLHLAVQCLRQGEYERAVPYAKEAAAMEPNWYAPHQIYGRALVEAGQTEAAIHELETSLQLQPENAQTHFHLARAYRQAGRAKDAAREQEEFKRLDQERRARDYPQGQPGQ
jgi:tetratricopeptide (TPR) repeat protein